MCYNFAVVFPGAIATNISVNSGVGAPASAEASQSSYKTLAPDKAAQMIVEAIEKDSYRVLVGSDAKFMDFLYRLNPQTAAGFIYKQMKNLPS